MDVSEREANINAYERLQDALVSAQASTYLDTYGHIPTIDRTVVVGINNLKDHPEVRMAEAHFSAAQFCECIDVQVDQIAVPGLWRMRTFNLVHLNSEAKPTRLSDKAYGGFRLSLSPNGDGMVFGVDGDATRMIATTERQAVAIRAFAVGCERFVRNVGKRAIK